MTALIVFAVGIVVGWSWETIRYYRLLTRAWPFLFVPTIANPTHPATGPGKDPR